MFSCSVSELGCFTSRDVLAAAPGQLPALQGAALVETITDRVLQMESLLTIAQPNRWGQI